MPPRSLAIAAFSTIVEWYDFTLYLYFATVLSRVFFGGGADSLLLTLGGFAIAYLMRPLGAVVLRPYRRPTRAAAHAAAVGRADDRGDAGDGAAADPRRGRPRGRLAAPALRCVMGFSVGGEYTGVVAYLLEGAPARRRGLIASSASAASEVGALLAVGVSALTVSLDERGDLDSWGWRIPFFFGAALAGSVWIARSTMHESPEFHRQQRRGHACPTCPLRHASPTTARASPARFAISALGSITYYVGITYVPAFLTSAGKLSESASLWLSTVAAVAVIAGHAADRRLLSDRIGRKPVLVGLCLGSAALPITMFSLMAAARAPGLAGAVVLAAACRRSERGRRGRDRRAIPRRRPRHRPCAWRDHGDRDLRRPDAAGRAMAGRAHRLADRAGHHDRAGGALRAAGVPDDAGNRP